VHSDVILECENRSNIGMDIVTLEDGGEEML
jgi:hypothetical protein